MRTEESWPSILGLRPIILFLIINCQLFLSSLHSFVLTTISNATQTNEQTNKTKTKKLKGTCSGLHKNVFHRLRCLNVQLPVGGNVYACLRGKSLLEKVCYWQQTLRSKSHAPFHALFSISSSSHDVCLLQCFPVMFFWNQKLNKPFLLYVALIMVLQPSNRKANSGTVRCSGFLLLSCPFTRQ